MPKRKTVITRNDYEYLKELLSSEFTQAISPSDFLESLEAEGWRVAFDKWTVGVKPPERPVGVFTLTRPDRTAGSPPAPST